jgi:pimeloyl-ACP methyl ester carboxylesterase
MRKHVFICWLMAALMLLAVACVPASSGEASTPPPSTPTPASRPITFTAPDGATIDGSLYGSGDTAVIFSVMGNCKSGWEDMADLAAQHGMTALTYQWRGCSESGSVDEDEIQKFVDDLRGAIDFMRGQGAEKIILAGASLGGCASAKLAVESQANGLIVLASPASIPQWGFEIQSADLATDIPKLFITAENDDTVSADETRALFDLAAGPKEWQTYPGTAHGTDLFQGESEAELQGRILEFLLAIAAE